MDGFTAELRQGQCLCAQPGPYERMKFENACTSVGFYKRAPSILRGPLTGIPGPLGLHLTLMHCFPRNQEGGTIMVGNRDWMPPLRN